MDQWKESIEWDDLITEILNQQCVLVVGPDIVNFPGAESFFKLLIQHLSQVERLRKDLEFNTDFIFENDELFQLQPNGRGDTGLYNFLKQFYKDRKEYDIPFKKISQIPFHLIISLLPDTRLSEIYEQMGFTNNFSYFPRTPGTVKNDAGINPSKETPFIYNLMGKIEDLDAVLTFDNYFEYLQNILPDNAFPPLLNVALANARSFLFLGVNFEKWNIQLLLRKIIPYNVQGKKRSKYSFLKGLTNAATSTFIAHRLDLDFYPVEPGDFLNELYDRFRKGSYLKNPVRKFKKRVFISYSHADSANIYRIKDEMDKADIEVVIDETNMPFGKQIRQFMTTVKNVDKIVVALSKNSLQSPWVSKEISLTLENQKPLFPCYLDKYFLDSQYVPETMEMIRSQLKTIDHQINKRNEIDPLDPLSDLKQERELWREFGEKLSEQAAFYQGSKAVPLSNEGIENNMKQLINSILL